MTEKYTPFAHICFDKIEEEWFLTGQGKGTKPLYSAETVEQLEAENAALHKQVDELRRDALAMRKGLINWRTKAWPGTDQVSVVDRDFPSVAAMTKEK